MKGNIKKIIAVALALILAIPLPALAADVQGTNEGGMQLPVGAAILMDAATGEVLYEQNADEALPPASVTKIMTLLLVMEAIDAGRISLSDTVTVSARAAGMGGSQVFLKEGEGMSVEEMLKCVVIASANDCAVALAEHVAGSEENFVAAMNARAAELGMRNTHFENTNGLDDTVENHVISARDIAIMSRELIRYPKILEFSGTWMDTIRDGTFGLTNTNRLVRFYPGCTGLKTGSTAKAGFCVSVTAERDGLSLICVIMAAKTRDERNAAAAKLLDYGFANYATFRADGGERTLALRGSTAREICVEWSPFLASVPKGRTGSVTCKVELPGELCAPVAKGDQVGEVVYMLGEKELGRVPILAAQNAEKIDFCNLLVQMFYSFLLI